MPPVRPHPPGSYAYVYAAFLAMACPLLINGRSAIDLPFAIMFFLMLFVHPMCNTYNIYTWDEQIFQFTNLYYHKYKFV